MAISKFYLQGCTESSETYLGWRIAPWPTDTKFRRPPAPYWAALWAADATKGWLAPIKLPHIGVKTARWIGSWPWKITREVEISLIMGGPYRWWLAVKMGQSRSALTESKCLLQCHNKWTIQFHDHQHSGKEKDPNNLRPSNGNSVTLQDSQKRKKKHNWDRGAITNMVWGSRIGASVIHRWHNMLTVENQDPSHYFQHIAEVSVNKITPRETKSKHQLSVKGTNNDT